MIRIHESDGLEVVAFTDDSEKRVRSAFKHAFYLSLHAEIGVARRDRRCHFHFHAIRRRRNAKPPLVACGQIFALIAEKKQGGNRSVFRFIFVTFCIF